VADAGERLASQYAAVPMRLQVDRRVVPALLTIDAATDPDFAGRGLYTQLATEVYARTADWAPVVYAFPNEASGALFYRKLGWVDLRPFPLLIRPLAGLRAIESRRRRRAASRRDVVPIRSFTPWGDRFWEALGPSLGTAVVRDAAYFEWRFIRSPFAYSGEVVLESGEPVAFAVTRESSLRGRRVTWLMELLALPGHDAEARLLLRRAIRAAAAAGSAGLLTIATARHPQLSVMRRAGLFRAPARLTSTMSFGARVNGPGVDPADVLGIDAWYLSGSDLDFV
jgi:Acetyltransferase (GNAT) domain